MELRRRHWVVGFGLALLGHGALLLVLTQPRVPNALGETRGNPGPVTLQIAAAGPQPSEAAAQSVSPSPETFTELESPQPHEPPVEAVPPELTEAKVVEAVLEPPPKPKPRPQPEVKPLSTPAEPVPSSSRPPQAPKAAADPSPSPDDLSAQDGSPGSTPSTSQPTSAAAKSAFTGQPDGDYLAAVRAWLEQHKEYPRPARMRRQEGTVLLRFVMDRNGLVLSSSIEQSSGHALLDQAVEDLLRRAEPLPPFPDTRQQARLEVVVPITFSLR